MENAPKSSTRAALNLHQRDKPARSSRVSTVSKHPKRQREKAAVLWSNSGACSKPGPLKRELSKGRVMLEVDEHRMSVSKDSDVSVAWFIALAAVAGLLAISLVSPG